MDAPKTSQRSVSDDGCHSCESIRRVIPAGELFEIQIETSISQGHAPEVYPLVPQRLTSLLS